MSSPHEKTPGAESRGISKDQVGNEVITMITPSADNPTFIGCIFGGAR